MPTKTKRSGSDRKRVSKQSHELNYTGKKVARKAGTTVRKGKAAVKRAKAGTRTASRPKVEKRAAALAR